MKEKKILIFADYYEPGYKAGGPIHTIKNIINTLTLRFDIFLITRNYDLNDRQLYNLPVLTWLDKGSYKIMYLGDKDLTVTNVKNQVSSISPDIIYLNSFFSPKLSAQLILSKVFNGREIIIAPRGEFSNGALNIKSFRKKAYLSIANIFNIYKNITFHASSQLEADDIISKVSCKEVKIAPDLVNTNISFSKLNYSKQPHQLRLCFISRIVEIKNLHYAIQVLNHPQIKDLNIILDIYGPIESTAYWNYCKKLVEEYQLTDKVFYKGVLKPEEVKDVFSKYDFFFFPTLGENFGHVIFESLSVGTPAIISDTTFWESYKNGDKWSFSFNLQHTAKLVEILIECESMDGNTYKVISENAFSKAQSFIQSDDIVNKTIQLFG